MSLPPPPGLKSASATPQPSSSLPVRPPVSINVPPSPTNSALASAQNGSGGGIKRPAHSAFTAFAPRSVISSNFRTASPAQYTAPATPSYSRPPQYSVQQDGYPSQAHYEPQSYTTDSSVPQIRNPFAPPTPGTASTGLGGAASIDPEMEAQILQWQSAYMSKDDSKGPANAFRRPGATGANTAPLGSTSRIETASPGIGPSPQSLTANDNNNSNNNNSSSNNSNNTSKTVHRTGGGTTWTDSTLLEWDPAHFRLFVGNLAGEVTDESLLKAFAKYPSVQKARVVRDKRTTKSRGYGFVSFSDGDEYFAAGREMQGKYIGSHPVLLKRSNTEVRSESLATQGGNHKQHGRYGGKGGNSGGGRGGGGGGNGGGAGLGKKEHGGINKKQPKTKGGLRVLG